MIEFLTTTNITSEVETILRQAKKEIVLVSPYLQLSEHVSQRLLDADQRNVNIDVVYGKEEDFGNEVEEVLTSLKNLNLHFFKNLHAKCYFNEERLVITSMNLYEFSRRNREMGVLVTSDEQLYTDALAEVTSIINHSTEQKLSKKTSISGFLSSFMDGTANKKEGYCIRCEGKIQYNPEAPYCKSCYSSWVKYKNDDFEENCCHECGDRIDTSMRKPLCYPCFK